MSMTNTLARQIALAITAQDNCLKYPDQAKQANWIAENEATITKLEAHLPHGSGFDSGTKIDRIKSTPNNLVLHTYFHHMDKHGCYDGWTHHTVVVRPCFIYNLDITIHGKNRNNIKDHIHEVFYSTLTANLTNPTNPTQPSTEGKGDSYVQL